jgi:hypothetical protein
MVDQYISRMHLVLRLGLEEEFQNLCIDKSWIT